MDSTKIMVLIHGKDRTSEVHCITDSKEAGKMDVVFNNSSTVYQYNRYNIEVLKNPETINFDGKFACIDKVKFYKPQLILDFAQYIRVIDENGLTISVRREQFSLSESDDGTQNAKQVMAYLKEVSCYLTSKEDDNSFLRRELSEINSINQESALNCYLKKQNIQKISADFDKTIFPFRFNLSQKSALENALTSSISIIAGPPGTGKTQTILNILANLVSIQHKSVAVVSNNNEAVKNVAEKLEQNGYGSLIAMLGNKDNQKEFFETLTKPSISNWDCAESAEELNNKIRTLNNKLNFLLGKERKKEQLLQQLRAWRLEKQYFDDYYKKQEIEEIKELPHIFNTKSDRIISFLAETSLAIENNRDRRILFKLKLLLKYGILNYGKLAKDEISLLLSLQKVFYEKHIESLEKQLFEIEKTLMGNSFKEMLDMHQQYSERLFRKLLYKKYEEIPEYKFTFDNYKNGENFNRFIKRYPILLSTTHSLRRSIQNGTLLDYVIIDESSQVDLITGVLALSCCKNIIIVGDEKQLPQIVDKGITEKLKTTPPILEYNYFDYSILTSVLNLYGKEVPYTILREHYRCNPKIIEFCNQKYYNGQLIAYTDEKISENPLVIYKAADGNHMREVTKGNETGKYNQRELDIIKDLLAGNKFNEEIQSIGIVTPYRKQANAAGRQIGYGVESDTVHKYQGREKETMIMSTVLDSSWSGRKGLEFVDDSHMVNVAVSRAIKKFILVTDSKLFFKFGRNINDLIRYMQYSTLDNNIIESDIVSVFDLLYQQYSKKLNYLKQRMTSNAKYKSEEIIKVLLEEILKEENYQQYTFTQEVLLRNLLYSTSLLTEEEEQYVNNRASLDFVIYYKLDKSCVLVLEVDGFAFHENNPEQLKRDRMKDKILEKYDIPILRLPTNGSGEREKIINALNRTNHDG